MARPNQYQYAQLPVFQWRTFDRDTLTFSSHPIIPSERIFADHPFADDPFKNVDPQPQSPAADEKPAPGSPEPAAPDMEGNVLSL